MRGKLDGCDKDIRDCTLREHLDGFPECTPGLAVHAVNVARSVDVGPRSVHGRVDQKAGSVDDGLVSTFNDVAFGINENQIRRFHGREVLGVGVEP